jgi:hypothetical protein
LNYTLKLRSSIERQQRLLECLPDKTQAVAQKSLYEKKLRSFDEFKLNFATLLLIESQKIQNKINCIKNLKQMPEEGVEEYNTMLIHDNLLISSVALEFSFLAEELNTNLKKNNLYYFYLLEFIQLIIYLSLCFAQTLKGYYDQFNMLQRLRKIS